MLVDVKRGLALDDVPISLVVFVPMDVSQAVAVFVMMRVPHVRLPVTVLCVCLNLTPTSVRNP